ncbi:MAG: ABC transporter ATP-binding protein [Saccharofermentans sp.]|nr:ABC transporter ATP-binding protein [Saccharofermentans sp.]
MSILEVKNLSAGYGKRLILEDISFEVNDGEICGIIGLNGSGKTTLIKGITNIIPHSGNAFIDGQDASLLSSNILASLCGFIPQKSGISIDLPVLDVVLMGFNPKLKLLQNPNSYMISKARAMIKTVGLEGRENDNFQKLSEGQKQLVLLARALASDSKILLMDELESYLDFKVRYKTMNLIKNLVKTNNMGALLSMHDINLALNTCDKLILIKDKKIADTIYPKTDLVADIEHKLSSIYGEVSVHKIKTDANHEQMVMLNRPEE